MAAGVYSMLFEIIPIGTGTCANSPEANMVRRLDNESENVHLTRSSGSWWGFIVRSVAGG